jgi:5'-methylthioadenosine phosphorylase
VPVNHIDFTVPYSVPAAQAHPAGRGGMQGGDRRRRVYAATQGPAPGERRRDHALERDGAHIVGMTGMPEAALAREVSLDYATIAVVANYAAGRGDSARAVPLDKIGEVLDWRWAACAASSRILRAENDPRRSALGEPRLWQVSHP